jgi:L-tartrate/succinate antiporter
MLARDDRATPYATTSGPVYLGSGYITSTEFWRLGGIFGTMLLIALLALNAPVLPWMRWL